MRSGSVSTFNSSGMSLIHIPFVSDNLGVLFLFKSNIQESQRLTNTTPLASQWCDNGVMWSIPSVSFCTGWGFEGANTFLVFRSDTFIVVRQRRWVWVLWSIDVGVYPGKEGKGVPAGHDADGKTRLKLLCFWCISNERVCSLYTSSYLSM